MTSDAPILPLSGIRVIEMSIWIQGPMAGMILADLGAEVINLEKPVSGTMGRGAKSMQGRSIMLPNGESVMYRAPNRNKKSITLDLRHEKSREVLRRLVKASDVFLSNLTEKSLHDFGADYETIKGINPRIIYAHGNTFGFKGPDAQSRGQDTTGMARSGFLMNTPQPDGSPTYPVGAMSDVLTATMLAFAIVTALLNRDRHGVSVKVTASQLQSMMWVQYFNLMLRANLGYDFPPFNRNKQWNPLFNFYRTKDGKWLAIGEYVTDKIWPDFCKALGRTEWTNDPRYRTEPLRKENNEDLIKKLEIVFASQPFAHWAGLLDGINSCFSLVQDTADLLNDPQVKANRFMTQFDDGLWMVRSPFTLEDVPSPGRGAPGLGTDLSDILVNVCGYTWEEIGSLASQNII